MKDNRGQAKAERNYQARAGLRTCPQCGRYYTKHARSEVCSVSCAEKKAKAEETPYGSTPWGAFLMAPESQPMTIPYRLNSGRLFQRSANQKWGFLKRGPENLGVPEIEN
jgi:hypothetical protein